MAKHRDGEAPISLGSTTAGIPPNRPRVFILSDLRLLREGLAAALARQSTIQVVGLSDLSLSPAEVAAFQPDVVLLDILRGALDRARPLREASPGTRIVALGVPEVEPVVMACARAGVSGFVRMDGSAHEVVTAVHSAVRGELVCSPRTAGMLLSRLRSLAAEEREPPPDALTAREREILALMSQGLSNKQIARRLEIRDATVKNHVHSILGKLGVRRRGEAVAHWRQDRDGTAWTTDSAEGVAFSPA